MRAVNLWMSLSVLPGNDGPVFGLPFAGFERLERIGFGQSCGYEAGEHTLHKAQHVVVGIGTAFAVVVVLRQELRGELHGETVAQPGVHATLHAPFGELLEFGTVAALRVRTEVSAVHTAKLLGGRQEISVPLLRGFRAGQGIPAAEELAVDFRAEGGSVFQPLPAALDVVAAHAQALEVVGCRVNHIVGDVSLFSAYDLCRSEFNEKILHNEWALMKFDIMIF